MFISHSSSEIWWKFDFLGMWGVAEGAAGGKEAQGGLYQSLLLPDRRVKPGRDLPSGNKWQDEREQNQVASGKV